MDAYSKIVFFKVSTRSIFQPYRKVSKSNDIENLFRSFWDPRYWESSLLQVENLQGVRMLMLIYTITTNVGAWESCHPKLTLSVKLTQKGITTMNALVKDHALTFYTKYAEI